jgi:hypothetical protein
MEEHGNPQPRYEFSASIDLTDTDPNGERKIATLTIRDLTVPDKN